MATDNEEKPFDSSTVRFDLEGSQHPHDSDGSLDEVDEFLELSTSNPALNSSVDSTTNNITNGTTVNTKTSMSNGTTDENKSTLKYSQR